MYTYTYMYPLDYFTSPPRFLILKGSIYIYPLLYPKIQSRCVFDVDSYSELRLELGALLGLTFSQTFFSACFGCDLPMSEMRKRLHFRSAVTGDSVRYDHHVSFNAGTADDVHCAGRAQKWGVTTQYRKIRRSGTKVLPRLTVLNLLHVKRYCPTG